jgi:hypothetical protein
MLRLRRAASADSPRPNRLANLALLDRPTDVAEGASIGATAEKIEIIRDFADPHLELVRLLREATEIEHALLVQYLYAAFSIKSVYPRLVGFGFPNASDLLGIAVQEMQHLHHTNRMLVAIGATPNLVRQDFPYEPDIYPFEFNLASLSLVTVAKYTYTEAAASALDPIPSDPLQEDFLNRLFSTLGRAARPNHLGSLYATIIEVSQELISNPPEGLPDLVPWIGLLEQIKQQGEGAHFRFFRDVLMGTHPGFNGRPDVWLLPPNDPNYPSFSLPINPSAFEGHPNVITHPKHRLLAWLSDLHYWIVLALLDLAYRTDDPIAMSLAKAHMTGTLKSLGQHLASLGWGAPFDPLSMGYAFGVSRETTVGLLRHLLGEASALERRIQTDLPDDFSVTQTEDTLAALR